MPYTPPPGSKPDKVLAVMRREGRPLYRHELLQLAGLPNTYANHPQTILRKALRENVVKTIRTGQRRVMFALADAPDIARTMFMTHLGSQTEAVLTWLERQPDMTACVSAISAGVALRAAAVRKALHRAKDGGAAMQNGKKQWVLIPGSWCKDGMAGQPVSSNFNHRVTADWGTAVALGPTSVFSLGAIQ